MRHPFEKYFQIELASLALLIVSGIIALLQGIPSLMLAALLMLAVSLFSEAAIYYYTHDNQQAIKQIAKAIMLFLITAGLFFYL
ncbi:hypothetical protein [Oceanobacillus halotolerans]|uniref:hypothetical protein n=1 Tax=Oceanobacillus halotolerans TaxID=2663380 RepID=UPI0013DB1DD2|nr:hypothetical protein [Oceanobacillus halotolerans]